MENHALDMPWWQDMVTGIDKPLIDHGFAHVTDAPGLGIELNPDVVKQHLKPGTGYFEPTDQWNTERNHDRLWS